MKRWAFNMAAGVSLVMCLSCCVLWIRGFWATESFRHVHPELRGNKILYREWILNFDCNRFALSRFVAWENVSHENGSGWPEVSPLNVFHEVELAPRFNLLPGEHGPHMWNKLGFEQWSHSGTYPDGNNTFLWCCTVLSWFPAAFFVILPVIALRRWYRERIPLGCCTQCGYDLRATPNRCPECGAVAIVDGPQS